MQRESISKPQVNLRFAGQHERKPIFAKTSPLYGYEQTLFAITQGGTFDDLRTESTKRLVEMDFEGYAIGGLAVGEPEEAMYRVLELSHPLLPEHKPRYLMGVGTPINILNAIERGIDMFDCVLPTREGRNGRVYTRYGALNIRAAKYAEDFRPLDEGFENYVCQNFSRAYIRHLFNVDEILGLQLCSLQNLSFFSLAHTHCTRTHSRWHLQGVERGVY